MLRYCRKVNRQTENESLALDEEEITFPPITFFFSGDSFSQCNFTNPYTISIVNEPI